MRNYFAKLGLGEQTSQSDIRNALSTLDQQTLDAEPDMTAVFESDAKTTQYQRAHFQYEAMAATRASMSGANVVDTHQWVKRLREFKLRR